MRILVVGSGGREHALAWKISQSPLVSELHCTPGNPGIEAVARLASLGVSDVDGIARFARERRIDLVVVGPEAPLVAGLADRLAQDGVPVFGPTAAAAELEGSKAFAKDVMRAAGIPTAESEVFGAPGPALEWARARGGRVVVKADGLAAGKGVVVCGDLAEAESAPVSGWWWRSVWRGRRRAASPSPTASGCSRSPPRRITSGSSTGTVAPTPGGWAPSPPRPA
jgi:phosphoribosylamine---glycine ligase